MNTLLETPEILDVPVAESNRSDIAREYLGEATAGTSPAHAATSHFKSDVGYGDAFVERHAQAVRYCADEKLWLVFDEANGWKRDNAGQIKAMAADYARELYRDAVRRAVDMEPDEGKRIIACMAALGNKKRIEPALSFAACNPAIVVCSEQLDADPFLVGVENGVVNLHDGSFQEHKREHLVTRRLAVKFRADATAPSWERFLAEVQPDVQMRSFLQRLSGYCLTGEIRDHVLPFHFGTGANGKGTFLEHALLKLAGSYGAKLTDSLVYASDRGHLPHLELANLCGRRFALGEENSESGRLNEALLKSITGGDRQKGRFHYGNFVEYLPTYKIALVGNHKPRIAGTDDGIWRRFLLVDWPVQIPETKRDVTLKDKLAAEMPGILNWCIAGAGSWLKDGLNPPESCTAATAEFRVKSDLLVEFITDCFDQDADGYSTKADTFSAYQRWAESQGVGRAEKLSKRELGNSLVIRGWKEGRAARENCHCWYGWRIKTITND
jgi:putative DNA primase/helicase